MNCMDECYVFIPKRSNRETSNEEILNQFNSFIPFHVLFLKSIGIGFMALISSRKYASAVSAAKSLLPNRMRPQVEAG